MQPQFILFVIFIISSSQGAPQFASNPSQNGQGYAYSGSVSSASDLLQNRNGVYGNQQIPQDPSFNPSMTSPSDLNNLLQQALTTFSNINQDFQNSMQNQQRALTPGMGLGLPGFPFMTPNNGFNLGFPPMQGLPMLSGLPLMQGFPNFNAQSAAGPASLIPAGLLQSAAALPQNLMIPNIFSRLNPGPQGNSYGSYAASNSGSNFNPNLGVPKTYNEATSATNDNITSPPASSA